jgi:hypothetical protein
MRANRAENYARDESVYAHGFGLTDAVTTRLRLQVIPGENRNGADQQKKQTMLRVERTAGSNHCRK